MTQTIVPQIFVTDLLTSVGKLTQEGVLEKTRGEFTLWTLAVKTWLAAQCRERGLTPLSNHEGNSEFMLDFVWWQEKPGAHAVLACECEWGNTRYPKGNPGLVAYDFDKLLSFKAPFKLMIFDSYGDTALQEDIIAELNKYLQEYGDHRQGEIYVAVDMSPQKQAWSTEIKADGPEPQLKFQPVPAAPPSQN